MSTRAEKFAKETLDWVWDFLKGNIDNDNWDYLSADIVDEFQKALDAPVPLVDGFKPDEEGYYWYEVPTTGCKIILNFDSNLCVHGGNYHFNDTHVSKLPGRFSHRLIPEGE